MVTPVYLTQKEKKRIVRTKRLEKEKDKQEKVKLGLAAPELPKIKMSNYQKIMSKDAINDPTGTEIIAKAIIQKRLDDHVQRN
jgi:U4/U6 small nuclear ribonucleoprotein PRP3